MAVIGFFRYRFILYWGVKTGPTTMRIEFSIGFKQRISAAATPVSTWLI
jgi:hypothetical protein